MKSRYPKGHQLCLCSDSQQSAWSGIEERLKNRLISDNSFLEQLKPHGSSDINWSEVCTQFCDADPTPKK